MKMVCYTEVTKKKEVNRMEKKLRHSRQRERIHAYLMTCAAHPSAEMVYNDLRPEIPGLSLATVYRNLKLLEELGLVRRVISYQGTERYDACCGDHAHFLCEKCGLLRDLDSANAEALRSAITLDAGFRMRKLDLTVTGLCPNCAE